MLCGFPPLGRCLSSGLAVLGSGLFFDSGKFHGAWYSPDGFYMAVDSCVFLPNLLLICRVNWPSEEGLHAERTGFWQYRYPSEVILWLLT